MTIIIIDESCVLTVESLELLAEYCKTMENNPLAGDFWTTIEAPSFEEYKHMFFIEPKECEEEYIINPPVLYDYSEKCNVVYKNNFKPVTNFKRRCNTSHSGWIGRKGYKKRKGK